MKKTLFKHDPHLKLLFLALALIVLTTSTIQGQNLVPNGSFEEVIECPEFLAELDSDCAYWFQSIFDPEIEDWQNPSPDYYHMCSPNDGLTPPNTLFGFQEPRTGEAYAGIVTYSLNNPMYREIIGVELIENLYVGSTYLVSFSASRGPLNFNTLASNNLGVKFTTDDLYLNSELVNNQAHFFVDSLLTDTVNWVDIAFEFVADSAYQFLQIGNFFNDSVTSYIDYEKTGISAYYFIDDIAISLTNSVRQNTSLEQIKLFPNPTCESLQVRIPESESIHSIRVLDNLGMTVREIRGNYSSNTTIELDDLSKGIYFLEVLTAEAKYRKKFMKD